MNEQAWIRVQPDEALKTVREKVRGVDLAIAISPYDLPEAFRGFYVAGKGVFRIEFRYGDEEPAETKRIDELVTVELGKHSQKLLAIEVPVDRHKVDVVSITLERADDTVQRLRDSAARPSARLNYRAVDEVLRENRENLELVAAVSA